MGCRFWNADETDWTNKNGFFLPQKAQKAQKGVGGSLCIEIVIEIVIVIEIKSSW